jgi:hypothetical protein
MRGLLAVLAAALLPACSAGDMSEAGWDTFTAPTDDVPPGTLRVDIFPPAQDDPLLPQSFVLFAEGEAYPGTSWRLAPSALLEGTLSGEVIRGWAAAPSEVVPIEGRIEAVSLPGFLQAGAARAELDEAGEARFAMAVPQGVAYALRAVPADGTTAAFSLEVTDVVEGSGDYSRELQAGAPVYGRVTDASGAGIPGVRLSVVLPERDLAEAGAPGVVAGVQSGESWTDEEGWYLARALPGQAYELRVLTTTLADGRVVPSQVTEFAVADANGAAVDVDVGTLQRASVSGHVVDAEGDDLQAVVRARSTALAEADASVELELTIQGDGAFTVQLAPGTYDLEFLPPAGARGATPVRMVGVEVNGNLDLGTVALGGSSPLSGVVTDADGNPVAGAAVNVSQVGFGENVFAAVTDSDGRYELDAVPGGDLVVVVTPPSCRSAITGRATQGGGSADVRLATGVPVEGHVLFDGAALPYAVVDFRDASTGASLGSAIADRDGRICARVDVDLAALGADTGDSGDSAP